LFSFRVTADPASLMSEELGCYTRYSDGKTDIQWIPKELVVEAESGAQPKV
jgi:hypothetical protein